MCTVKVSVSEYNKDKLYQLVLINLKCMFKVSLISEENQGIAMPTP